MLSIPTLGRKKYHPITNHTFLFFEIKKPTPKSRLSLCVQAERLELSHLAALDPKFFPICTYKH